MTSPIAQAVCLDFFERPSTNKALIVGADPTAIKDRWQSLLAAMSSGIAHADDPSPAVEKRLTELRKRELVFAAIEDPPVVPPNTAIAYLVGTVPDAWRAALAGTTVVNVS